MAFLGIAAGRVSWAGRGKFPAGRYQGRCRRAVPRPRRVVTTSDGFATTNRVENPGFLSTANSLAFTPLIQTPNGLAVSGFVEATDRFETPDSLPSGHGRAPGRGDGRPSQRPGLWQGLGQELVRLARPGHKLEQRRPPGHRQEEPQRQSSQHPPEPTSPPAADGGAAEERSSPADDTRTISVPHRLWSSQDIFLCRRERRRTLRPGLQDRQEQIRRGTRDTSVHIKFYVCIIKIRLIMYPYITTNMCSSYICKKNTRIPYIFLDAYWHYVVRKSCQLLLKVTLSSVRAAGGGPGVVAGADGGRQEDDDTRERLQRVRKKYPGKYTCPFFLYFIFLRDVQAACSANWYKKQNIYDVNAWFRLLSQYPDGLQQIMFTQAHFMALLKLVITMETFWSHAVVVGPPGVGKLSLVKLAAHYTRAR